MQQLISMTSEGTPASTHKYRESNIRSRQPRSRKFLARAQFPYTDTDHTDQPLASTHFDPPLNFLDIFLPINIASADRARAFLWLMFHYLEGPDQPNPYDDDYSRQHPGKVPWLRRLSEEVMAQENVDTPEEIEWGKSMSEMRNIFLQKLVKSSDKEKKEKVKASASASKGPIPCQSLI
jgi:hypothetical protein